MIGVYDSGSGGLSVWREVVALLPNSPLMYLGDHAHVPYGSRPIAQVRELAHGCVGWLVSQGCGVVVVACNTASAAALHPLRQSFPNTRIVGMEPAIKPAIAQTQTGVVGVLATKVTFQGQLFASLVERYAGTTKILTQACEGWVERVERLEIESDAMISTYIHPLLEKGADTFVLGCTHFPFLRTAIERSICQWQAANKISHPFFLIDPAPAVARQTAKVRHELVSLVHSQNGINPDRHTLCTTASASRFSLVASALLGYNVACKQVAIRQ